MPNTPPLPTFSRRLRELRMAAGLSQAQLARAAGVGRQYVYQLEAGRRAPSWDVVQRLAAALGVGAAAFEGD